MNKYSDIINMNMPKLKNRMSMHDRAAQFSSFAALSGHSEAVHEKERITSEKLTLSDEQIIQLNKALLYIQENISENPEATIICFDADALKSGGRYIKITGIVKKFFEYEQKIELKDGTVILFEDIFKIEIL